MTATRVPVIMALALVAFCAIPALARPAASVNLTRPSGPFGPDVSSYQVRRRLGRFCSTTFDPRDFVVQGSVNWADVKKAGACPQLAVSRATVG